MTGYVLLSHFSVGCGFWVDFCVITLYVVYTGQTLGEVTIEDLYGCVVTSGS